MIKFKKKCRLFNLPQNLSKTSNIPLTELFGEMEQRIPTYWAPYMEDKLLVKIL